MERIKLQDDDIDIEQLIEIARSSSKPGKVDELTEAKQFTIEMGIEPGETPISAAIIYDTYKLWKGRWETKQSKRKFFNDFKKLFESKKRADNTYYMLNPEPFDTSLEASVEVKQKNKIINQFKKSKTDGQKEEN